MGFDEAFFNVDAFLKCVQDDGFHNFPAKSGFPLRFDPHQFLDFLNQRFGVKSEFLRLFQLFQGIFKLISF